MTQRTASATPRPRRGQSAPDTGPIDGGRWRRRIAPALFLAIGGLVASLALAQTPNRPWRIGVLTTPWGPPPAAVAVRDGLASGATAQPTVPELLRTLELSSYAPGVWPPPFTGRTPDGQELSLADLRGHVVLLNFWASWCTACGPEMPMFERLHQAFAARGLRVLGVNFREGPETVRRYARQRGLRFPLILDPQGEITRGYGVIGLPTTFVIGRDGRPVALAIGPRAWGSEAARALIAALLAEPAAP